MTKLESLYRNEWKGANKIFEAKISYVDGREYSIEASSLECLRERCKPFIKYKDVYSIHVSKLENLRWFKDELTL